MFKLTFWKDVLERAIKTAAQSAILSFGADQFNVINVDWISIAGFAAGGFVLSVLTSIISLPMGDRDSASMVK